MVQNFLDMLNSQPAPQQVASPMAMGGLFGAMQPPQPQQAMPSGDTGSLSTQIQQWLGAVPPADNGIAQNILSARFNPQQFQPTLQDESSAIINSAPAGAKLMTGTDVAGGRMSSMMDVISKINQMQQVQLELAKINEDMRHNRATEGMNPNALPIGTAPIAAGNAPTASVGTGVTPINNPGNLRPVGASTGFQQFPTPQAGADAMRNDLMIKLSGNSQVMQGPPTLRNIISTWAPPNENNTEQLVQNAAQRSGLSPDQPLGPQHVNALMSIIAQQEGNPGAISNTAQPTPLFRGNEPMTQGLEQNKQWEQLPNGEFVARQVPGTAKTGPNGELLNTDPMTGKTTAEIPKNPQAQAKLEQGLIAIANKFDELRKAGGTVETGGAPISNIINTAAGSSFTGPEWLGSPEVGGQDIARMGGTKAQQTRDEINLIVKQQILPYMQAIGATPGMERAVGAQMQLLQSLGAKTTLSRDSVLSALGQISRQTGTGELANNLGLPPTETYRGLSVNDPQASSSAPAKVITMDQVNATAQQYGKSPQQVIQDAKAK